MLGASKPAASTSVAPAAVLSPLVEVAIIIGVSAALLVPCFWQQHIQAGDLSSHVYNSWLATEIKRSPVEGLSIVPVWTNVLCDWALGGLLGAIGPMGAERVVVGAAVLLFFWGSFYLVAAATGRRPWLLAPCLAMLTYGLVFHLGLLNYYLSTGLCLSMIAVLWQPTWLRGWLALPLGILAVLAHPAPVIWAVSVLAYLYLARLIPPHRRFALLIAGMAALGLLQQAVISRFPYHWSPEDLMTLSGILGISAVEQVWLFGAKYLMVAGGLFLIWCTLFLERLDRGSMLRDAVVQIWILHLVAFIMLPSRVQFPQYQHVLAYIPQRISLLAAVIFCIMVGSARYGRGMTRLSALVAAAFFTFLYVDDRAFDQAEREVTDLVATAPGQRVVAAITDSGTRINALSHMVDRACIGRCYSFGNYEPATAQFRVRVAGPNQVVASSMEVVKAIEEGRHIVTAQEAPMYAVCPCEEKQGRFCLHVLRAGERTCSFSLPVAPQLWGAELKF